MRVSYDPHWQKNASKRIHQAFYKAYQNSVSEKDIQSLNGLYQEFMICLNFIRECDSNIHKNKILPGLIQKFHDMSGIKMLLT